MRKLTPLEKFQFEKRIELENVEKKRKQNEIRRENARILREETIIIRDMWYDFETVEAYCKLFEYRCKRIGVGKDRLRIWLPDDINMTQGKLRTEIRKMSI